MDVEVKEAVAAGRKSDFAGSAHYFCSDDCKKQFDKEPGKYPAK
jgi:YHS domain-containing protein